MPIQLKKANLTERQGRKAAGLPQSKFGMVAGLPTDWLFLCVHRFQRKGPCKTIVEWEWFGSRRTWLQEEFNLKIRRLDNATNLLRRTGGLCPNFYDSVLKNPKSSKQIFSWAIKFVTLCADLGRKFKQEEV